MWKTVKHYILPNLTGLLVLSLLLAGAAGAGPLKQVWQSSPTIQSTSTTTFSYQGRLADAAGSPITDNVAMLFKLYDSPTATTPLWEEHHDGANSVAVSDGLFHVLLGSIEPIPLDIISGDLYLGISVSGDAEMEPRELLASVPYAMVAGTVLDGAVTSEKMDVKYWNITSTTWETEIYDEYVSVPGMEFSFTPVVDGVILVNLSTRLRHSTDNTQVYCGIGINDDPISKSTTFLPSWQRLMSCSTNLAYPVQAGQSYQFSLMVYAERAGTFRVSGGRFSQLSAVFFGSSQE